MNIVDATKLAFKKAFDYESRSSRSEYWWYQLSYVILIIIAELVGYAIGLYEITYYIAEVALLVPAIALAVRRLHDIGMSGWWNLIALTIIGLIPLIIWYATPGHRGSNKFGQNPLEVQAKSDEVYSRREDRVFETKPMTNYSMDLKEELEPERFKKQETRTPKGFKIIKKIK